MVRGWFRKDLSGEAPIVIGGTGGSGTRVVQAILENAGVFMGENLNVSKDAMDFEPFLDATINPVLEVTHSLHYQPEALPEKLREKAQSELQKIARGYIRGKPKQAERWGWKNPRAMYLLPLIHAVFPKMHFIHVVRDGRDMAFSRNQHQRDKHYASLFGMPVEEEALGSIALWTEANLGAATWAEQFMPERYTRLRFEDLCGRPEKEISFLLDVLGLEASPGALVRCVEAPQSLGRWQQEEDSVAAPLTDRAEKALQKFGYIN